MSKKKERKNYGEAIETDHMILFWNPPCAFCQWTECEFIVSDQKYCTAEQYMMAEKARLFGDEDIRMKILQTIVPSEQKALGRKVSNFDEEIWKKNCLDIVVRGNLAKFKQNAEMYNILLKTGSKMIVEASPLDKIWGIGLAPDDPKALNPANWKGENLLGKALMKVRDILLNETAEKL
jgi:ribA/ribD-fused uncharacterized protein